MKEITFKLTGTAPLLMHADTLNNPIHPLRKELAKITGKRTNKTDDDHARLLEIDWLGGVYHDDELGPYVPAFNIERMMRDAARMTKKGKNVERGAMIFTDRIKLEYAGPRDLNALLVDSRFRDVRTIKNSGSGGRVLRCRPRFDGWSLKFSLAIDEGQVDREMAVDFMESAGRLIGLGDYRPRFGRFTVEVVA